MSNDILRKILNDMVQAQRQQPAAGGAAGRDALAELIAGALGGAAGGRPRPSGQSPAGAAPNINDLIGSLIGGAVKPGSSQRGGLADLVSAVLGGAAGGATGQINPVAQMLADRLGIPPMLAQIVVAYFMSKVLSGQAQPAAGAPSAPDAYGIGKTKPKPGQLDLDDLLTVMDDAPAMQTRLANAGVARELAMMTGLDERSATNAVQELVKIVGEQRRQPIPVPAQINLKGLLDSWK